jgi:hypothetical protein
MNKEFLDYLAEVYPESVILDGLDDGIIGVDVDGHVVYSYNKCVQSIVEKGEMTLEEAEEWIDYNTIRAIPYMGEFKPIMMYEIENFV